MARQKPLLTDQQWAKIKSLLPSERPGPKGGRPRCNNRKVLEGIRWVLKTGARWRDLPPEYPKPHHLVAAAGAGGRRRAVVVRPPSQARALFERLSRRFYAEVYNYLCWLSRDVGLAEDLTQETLMQIWQHPPELRGERARLP